MKKIALFTLLISIFSIGKAQFGFFGGGGLSVVYDPSNYGVALQQLTNSVTQISQMTEQIDWAIQTKNQMTEIWSLQDKIQRDLQQLKGMADMKWNDMQDLLEQSMLLSSDPSSYFDRPLPYLDRYDQLINDAIDLSETKEFFDFFYGRQTAYDPPLNLKEWEEKGHEQAIKQYSADMLTQQEKIRLGQSYRMLAEKMAVKAEELRQSVATPGAMSMTEGERILAQHAAQNTMLESMRLKEQSNRLLEEVRQKGETQTLLDKNRYLRLRLSKMREVYSDLIPEE